MSVVRLIFKEISLKLNLLFSEARKHNQCMLKLDLLSTTIRNIYFEEDYYYDSIENLRIIYSEVLLYEIILSKYKLKKEI